MKKVRFLVTLCILLIAGTANAQQQVSINEAKKAAVQSLNLRQNNGFTRDETNIKKVNTRQNEVKQTLMYEVIFDEGQGILLSGSKACLPVLGYFTVSDENRSIFDDDAPCGLKSMLWEYEEQIALCFKNDTIQLYEEEAWQRLQNNIVTRASPGAVDIVSPLITTQWNQRWSNDWRDCDAYNYYVTKTSSNCTDCTSKRCAAGCVAVAMAQIMNFWKYPVYHPFLITQFDWCNMTDELRTTSPNYTKERNAIAYLIRDCGAKVNMDYCSSGCSSGASSKDARDALVDKFGYSSNAVYFHRTYAPGNLWKLLIKDNLDAYLPVFYKGRNSNDGHAFICDGYDSHDFFHFNWGWGGSYDNYWFTLDNLNPGNTTFNSSQAAIINLLPSGYQNYCNFSMPLSTYYNYCYNIWNPFMTFPPPHQNVPQTFTVLESADATSPASWRTIEPGQTVTYTAHEQVILKPGFHAKAGSNFRAYVEPCNACTQFLMVRVTENGEELVSQIMSQAIEKITEPQSEEKIEKKMMDDEFYLKLYPNPSAGDVTIEYNTSKSDVVEILLHDSQGKLVYKLKNNSTHDSGMHRITLNGAELPAGIYFCTLQTGNKHTTEKLIIVK